MISQSLRVAVPELVQQPRRSLDVGEKEGDGAARKLGHHPGMMPAELVMTLPLT